MSKKKIYFNDKNEYGDINGFERTDLPQTGEDLDTIITKINNMFRMIKEDAIQKPAQIISLTLSDTLTDLVNRGLSVTRQPSPTILELFIADTKVAQLFGEAALGFFPMAVTYFTGGGLTDSPIEGIHILQSSYATRVSNGLQITLNLSANYSHSNSSYLHVVCAVSLSNDPNA